MTLIFVGLREDVKHGMRDGWRILRLMLQLWELARVGYLWCLRPDLWDIVALCWMLCRR